MTRLKKDERAILEQAVRELVRLKEGRMPRRGQRVNALVRSAAKDPVVREWLAAEARINKAGRDALSEAWIGLYSAVDKTLLVQS